MMTPPSPVPGMDEVRRRVATVRATARSATPTAAERVVDGTNTEKSAFERSLQRAITRRPDLVRAAMDRVAKDRAQAQQATEKSAKAARDLVRRTESIRDKGATAHPRNHEHGPSATDQPGGNAHVHGVGQPTAPASGTLNSETTPDDATVVNAQIHARSIAGADVAADTLNAHLVAPTGRDDVLETRHSGLGDPHVGGARPMTTEPALTAGALTPELAAATEVPGASFGLSADATDDAGVSGATGATASTGVGTVQPLAVDATLTEGFRPDLAMTDRLTAAHAVLGQPELGIAGAGHTRASFGSWADLSGAAGFRLASQPESRGSTPVGATEFGAVSTGAPAAASPQTPNGQVASPGSPHPTNGTGAQLDAQPRTIDGPVTGVQDTADGQTVSTAPVPSGQTDAAGSLGTPVRPHPSVPPLNPADGSTQPAGTAVAAGTSEPGTPAASLSRPAALGQPGATDRAGSAAAVDTTVLAAPVTSATPSTVNAPTHTASVGGNAGAAPLVHQQIVSAVSPLLRRADGSYRIELSLTPEHLGAVKVHLELRDGAITVNLQAASQSGHESLRDNLDDLRRSLQEQARGNSDVTLDVAGPGPKDSGLGSGQQGQPGQQGQLSANLPDGTGSRPGHQRDQRHNTTTDASALTSQQSDSMLADHSDGALDVQI